MQDPRTRKQLETLSAHVEGLGAALETLGSEGFFESVRRLARSLARAAEEAGFADVAAEARLAQAAPDADLPAAAQALLGSIERAGASPPLERSHEVLIVEDDATTGAALRAYLTAPGRNVQLAASASRADEILAARPVDLVVLDLILPDRDGRDLLLSIREDPRTEAIPVIVLSASGGKVAKAECMAVGANEFLEKPADPRTLRAAVGFHLKTSRRHSDSGAHVEAGLLSRAGLAEAYRAAVSHPGRLEGPLGVALVVIDEAHRGVGDGETAGADVLASVAEHLAGALAERDRLGRWSAGELVALLPETDFALAQHRLGEGLSRLAAAAGADGLRDAPVVPSLAVGFALAERDSRLRDVVSIAHQSLRPARVGADGTSFEPRPSEPDAPTRVLLVEDDRVTASLIQHRLVREGFDVMDFLNGEDAHRWASAASFDLAVLDVKVPGMDGFELLERFRADPRLAHVPVVMLTGLGSEADVVRGLELGANDYMLKPFSPTELMARVRRLTQERKAVHDRVSPPGGATGEADL